MPDEQNNRSNSINRKRRIFMTGAMRTAERDPDERGGIHLLLADRMAMVVYVLFFLFMAEGTVWAHEKRGMVFSDLPAPARMSISEAIGRDNTAYHVSLREDVASMKNKRQSMDAVFDAAGARLLVNGKDSLILYLEGWGYGEALRPTPSSGFLPGGKLNWVESGHGNITEWYINSPLGIEQGFTLHDRPSRAENGPLVISLSLKGSLHPEMNGEGILLRDDAGRAVLKYSGLAAWDARERPLETWMELEEGRLRLFVDDHLAVYPVTVDPWVQNAKLTASDGAASDYFGYSVAVSGITVVGGGIL